MGGLQGPAAALHKYLLADTEDCKPVRKATLGDASDRPTVKTVQMARHGCPMPVSQNQEDGGRRRCELHSKGQDGKDIWRE